MEVKQSSMKPVMSSYRKVTMKRRAKMPLEKRTIQVWCFWVPNLAAMARARTGRAMMIDDI